MTSATVMSCHDISRQHTCSLTLPCRILIKLVILYNNFTATIINIRHLLFQANISRILFILSVHFYESTIGGRQKFKSPVKMMLLSLLKNIGHITLLKYLQQKQLISLYLNILRATKENRDGNINKG